MLYVFPFVNSIRELSGRNPTARLTENGVEGYMWSPVSQTLAQTTSLNAAYQMRLEWEQRFPRSHITVEEFDPNKEYQAQ